MSINFTIDAATVDELAKTLADLARLFTDPAPVVVLPENVEVRTRGRKAKPATIDHDPEETKEDVHGGSEEPTAVAADDGERDEGGAELAAVAESSDGSDSAPAEEEQPAEVDAVANAPKPVTIDEARLFTIGKYLNVVFDNQEDRKIEFGNLLAKFGVTSLKQLSADKASEWVAEVESRMAAKAAA